MIMPWLDRVSSKKQINNWLVNGSKVFLLVVKESTEIDDIVIWFRESAGAIKLALIALTSDSEVTKIGLIENIVQEFGDNNFPNYIVTREKLRNIHTSIIIEQNLGVNIEATTILMEGNEMQATVNGLDPVTLRRFYLESNFDEMFKSFKLDLTNLCEKAELRIICKFLVGGFDELENNFKTWFKEKFITYLRVSRIKAIIICEKSGADLTTKFDFVLRNTLNDLELAEIGPVCLEYLGEKGVDFVDGAINPDTETIAYNDFKNRLQRKLAILNT
jgi:hypothetical protein